MHLVFALLWVILFFQTVWLADNCFSLNSLVIPGRVTCIGNGAFSECSSLRSIVIPDSVTSIGSYAFRGCFSLESLVIPDSVISIGNSVFYECNFQNDLKQELISRFGDKIFVKPWWGLWCDIWLPDSGNRVRCPFSESRYLKKVISFLQFLLIIWNLMCTFAMSYIHTAKWNE